MIFKRIPQDFFGDSLVIGCGNTFFNRLYDYVLGDRHKLHSNKNNFYTIDADPKQNPDCVWKITGAEHHVYLRNKFRFVVFEYLVHDAYLEHNGHFKNAIFEPFLKPKYGAVLIIGKPVSENSTPLKGQVYLKSKAKNSLIVRAPAGVNPTLVIKSLNFDAQEMIRACNIDAHDLTNEPYDIKINESFVKQAALDIIFNQSNRLEAEIKSFEHSRTPAFFAGIAKRTAKNTALKILYNAILEDYPAKTLNQIITETRENNPVLTAGKIQHLIKDALDVIISMEAYHLYKCKQLNQSHPGFSNRPH